MQEPSASEWRRLHQSAVFIWILDNFRLGLFPLLAIAFSGGWVVIPVLGAGLVASAVHAYLRWRSFGFKIEAQSLVIRDGVISVKQTVLPLARVQSVDSVQKLRHSMFGVVELRAEAVGSKSTEGRLPALLPAEAEMFRRQLLLASELAPLEETKSPPLAKLTTKDLVVAGVTGGRVAVFAVFLGYVQDLIPGDPFEAFIKSQFDEVGRQRFGVLVGVIITVALLVLVSILISLIATVIVYWDFTVTKQANRLVVSRGLFEKRVSSVPLHRVQAGRLQENPIRRLLGLASATVVVAGYSGQKQELEETSMLLPIGSRKDVAQLLTAIVGTSPIRELDAAPQGAFARRLLYALIPGLFLLASAPLWRPGLPAGLTMLLVGAFAAYGLWKALGSAVGEDHVTVRSGLLVRTTTITPITNVQDLGFTRTPIQRLLGLATVEFGIPKTKPRANDLNSIDAERMFERVEGRMYGVRAD